jgi:hypothetical protein
MPKKLNALIDDDRVKRLYHALVDEDLSFTEWLGRQIGRYLEERGQPTTRLKGGGKQRRK